MFCALARAVSAMCVDSDGVVKCGLCYLMGLAARCARVSESR